MVMIQDCLFVTFIVIKVLNEVKYILNMVTAISYIQSHCNCQHYNTMLPDFNAKVM